MKPLCHFFLCLFVSFVSCAASLHDEVELIAKSIGGRVGVSAVLIESGEHVALHGDQTFFMASVVEFPVALRVLQLVDEGKLRLDQKAPVRNSDVVSGSTVLASVKPGAEFTIRDLLGNMIGSSDNTSCDVLMALCGGPPAVMARVQALGIQGIRIDRNEKQLASDYARARAQFLRDVRDTSTPDAMTALLAKFQATEALKPATTGLLREIMENSAIPTRLKGLLPPGTLVAHKTGSWREAALNDVGIITLPGSRHIAIAVFTNGSKRDVPVIEHAIAEIAQAAYDHWSQPSPQ